MSLSIVSSMSRLAPAVFSKSPDLGRQIRFLSLLGLQGDPITSKSTKKGPSKDSLLLIQDLQKTVQTKFPTHPFTHQISRNNSERVMGRYYAMSQAFPFIQAGAYKDLVLRAISQQIPLTEEVEKTFTVGAFLCSDETGSHYLLQKQGMAALPNILDTKAGFHANLLKKDLEFIFGHPVGPDYCENTQIYLTRLMENLGAESKLKRGAMMVAFEMHAERMIQELWGSLTRELDLKKKDLGYFEAHVGGDDPAEAYHVALTQRLVQDLVLSPKEREDFTKLFIESYAMNIQWCEAICKPKPKEDL